MDISGAFSNAMYGMNRASDQVSQASADIASAPARIQQQQDVVMGARTGAGTQAATETASETTQSVTANTSVTSALVDLQSGEQTFKANARVAETADSMLGTLIDVQV